MQTAVPSGLPDPAPLTEAIIQPRLIRALKDVFRIMLRRPIEICGDTHQGLDAVPAAEEAPDGITRMYVLGRVGFSGRMNGELHLYLPEDFAAACTRQLLRASDSYTKRTADTTVSDAVGEITNMVAGVFKNALAASGYTCRLTLPKVLRCRVSMLEPAVGTSRYVYQFDSSGVRILVELLLKA